MICGFLNVKFVRQNRLLVVFLVRAEAMHFDATMQTVNSVEAALAEQKI